jgi:hypothetical protein
MGLGPAPGGLFRPLLGSKTAGLSSGSRSRQYAAHARHRHDPIGWRKSSFRNRLRHLIRPLLGSKTAGLAPVPGPASMPPTTGMGKILTIGGSLPPDTGCATLCRRRRPPAGLVLPPNTRSLRVDKTARVSDALDWLGGVSAGALATQKRADVATGGLETPRNQHEPTDISHAAARWPRPNQRSRSSDRAATSCRRRAARTIDSTGIK